MVIVAVEIIVDEAQADAFATAVAKHRENSLGDEGCLGFDVARDDRNPARFLIWETYHDAAAFEVHKNAPFLAAFRDATQGMVTSRDITVASLLPRTKPGIILRGPDRRRSA